MASATAFSMMASSVVAGLGGTFVVDEDALVDGRLGEAEGVDSGGSDALVLLAADERELAQDRGHRGGQSFKAEVGEPETEIELIGP